MAYGVSVAVHNGLKDLMENFGPVKLRKTISFYYFVEKLSTTAEFGNHIITGIILKDLV